MTGLPVKDEDSELPVAEVWRPTLERVVAGLAAGDFDGLKAIPNVQLAEGVADQARDYIADYGETLTSLPAESWTTSVCRWSDPYWEVLVDLWTRESGASDLVLSARVYESDDEQFRFELGGVYVP